MDYVDLMENSPGVKFPTSSTNSTGSTELMDSVEMLTLPTLPTASSTICYIYKTKYKDIKPLILVCFMIK